jgi:hypothetical protein
MPEGVVFHSIGSGKVMIIPQFFFPESQVKYIPLFQMLLIISTQNLVIILSELR